jgi:hypothetical protein
MQKKIVTMIENFSIVQIRDEIIKFKNDPDFQKLENFYYSKSFAEILGVSRREISHSGFLAQAGARHPATARILSRGGINLHSRASYFLMHAGTDPA